MDGRGRYVSFFAILWVFYIIFNHERTRSYIDAAHDAVITVGFSSGRVVSRVVVGGFLALLIATVSIHYTDNVFQFVKNKIQARRRKEEELERGRLARMKQAQEELEARCQAEQEALKRLRQEEAAGKNAENMKPPIHPAVEAGMQRDAPDDGPMHTKEKWLKKMQDAIDSASTSASNSNSASAAALADLGTGAETGAERAAEQQQQWLERLQASTDAVAAELQGLTQQEKQRTLQAIDAKLEKLKEGKKAREEGLHNLHAFANEREEQERQVREGIAVGRRLRDDQDREYEESLEQDRRKQEERARQVGQAEREQQELAELKALKTTLRAELKEEPPAGAADVTTLRVRLPQGSSHTRRFTDTARVKDVKNWVQSLEDFPLWRLQHWQLVNSYPRVAFDEELDLATIADGCPSISLFVERL